MAQTTKRALAASLKKMLSKKPLDKITVKDITDDCELNRQTFYYHFQDIYDLVEWIFQTEAEQVIGGNRTLDTWQEGFLQLFDYVLENRELALNVYRSLSRDTLEEYLRRVTFALLMSVINEQAENLPVSDADKRFIADFYKHAFVGLMLDWVRSGMKEDPAAIVRRLNILIEGDIEKALEKFEKS
ncbi:TetR-like C-terminal domain-containing protein [Feifania hominis]|uniref:TetR/AcrR family transcriptional regulator C-terminal domain-containing protein n=1 Tax=Feifania hominis TaxID=2763660 RepID=A0A926DD65_9FIRM|nr:TetR-like C-terminal domain-containing protein [Feifania hominis]MBC8535948.1 TetR/AcrR family transcriptional regulator C-terminal domain-containing protein [Feifania hominis]